MSEIIHLSRLKVVQIKEELKKRNIPSHGKKHVLVNKLKSALNTSYIDLDNENSNDTEVTETQCSNGKIRRDRLKTRWSNTYEFKINCLEGRLEKLEFILRKLLKKKRGNTGNNKNHDMEKAVDSVKNTSSICGNKGQGTNELTNNKLTSSSSDDKQLNNTRKEERTPDNIKNNISVTNNKSRIITSNNKLPKSDLQENAAKSDIFSKNENYNKSGSKSKFLILADSHGRNSVHFIQRELSDKYDVQCIFKPNASFENVINDLKSLTRKFTKNDVVVIIAGSNDAIKGATIDSAILNETINNCKNTNLIIVTIPYWENRPVLNRFSYNINLALYNKLRNNHDVKLIDINAIVKSSDFTLHGLHLNKRGKFKLSKVLIETVINDIVPSLHRVTAKTITRRLTKSDYIVESNLITIVPTSENTNIVEISDENDFEKQPLSTPPEEMPIPAASTLTSEIGLYPNLACAPDAVEVRIESSDHFL